MIDSGEKLSWTEPDKAWLEPIESANNGNVTEKRIDVFVSQKTIKGK